jgi:DNA-binding NtrC family response regulator
MLSQGRNALLQDVVAVSSAMVEVLRSVQRYVTAHTLLVVTGAPGTGKGTLARLVHVWGARAGALVCCTTGQFEPEVVNAEIFGEERRVPAAIEHRAGLLEEAGQGTLLLDDFEQLPRSTQTLLLQAATRGAYRPLDARRDLSLRCRLIIGLRELPDVLVERGVLTAEVRLHLGLSVIRLPPLDERREDIPAIACRFLEQCGRATGVVGPTRFAPDALEALQAAMWPGNLPHLRAVVREAYLRAQGRAVLRVDDLANLVQFPVRFERRGDPAANGRAIRFALDLTRGRARDAARLLRTAPSTIYRYQATTPTSPARNSRVSDSAAPVAQSDAPPLGEL